MKHPRQSSNRCRIVLTGGPGGGKTTAADLFRREIGDRVAIVPEAATILSQGGFPRSRESHASRIAQAAIFHVQRHIEEVQSALFPGRTLLCDRGTVDGAAYWPGEADEYFVAVGTTLDAELARYDAVSPASPRAQRTFDPPEAASRHTEPGVVQRWQEMVSPIRRFFRDSAQRKN